MSLLKLRLYDSMSREKKIFLPLHDNQIKIYVCGITVYDYCHIGHARVILFFDSFVRFLRKQGYQVCYVRNITDVDDKIIQRALEQNISCDALTKTFIQAMQTDFSQLGTIPPDFEPRATANIQLMIDMIAQLIEKDLAYVAKNGDVCYRVRAFPRYGALARRNIDALQSGSRVDAHADKDDPLDFVLWKLAKPDEPSWSSPWGKGRPGWHIECSAMANDILGKTIDIHGGGVDLQFPHHENEVAQSEGCHDAQFVRHWMHVGALQVNDEKMSKSLGNFVTIREALAQHHPEVVRYFMLGTHYRKPLQYGDDYLKQAKHVVDKLYTALQQCSVAVDPLPTGSCYARFIEALSDDFNTPLALTLLSEQLKSVNKALQDGEPEKAQQEAGIMRAMADQLGLLQTPAKIYLNPAISELNITAINALVAEREAARAVKDWALADQLRDRLLAEYSVVVKDGADGSSWERA